MSLKSRLQNLERQPAKHEEVSPDFRKLLRLAEQSRQRWREDPEGCERRRQESLRELGFPEGSSPTGQEILQRLIERRG